MMLKWNRFRMEQSLYRYWREAAGSLDVGINVSRILQACIDYPCVTARTVAFALHSENVKRNSSHHLDAFVSAEAAHARSRLMMIAVIAAVLPLLGLLGTVTGMITTFDAIGTSSSTDPQLLAGGITQALLTTEAGLLTALPILLGHVYLRSRMRRELEAAAGAARHVCRFRKASEETVIGHV
jgi:biopolymer transport protein ExbB